MTTCIGMQPSRSASERPGAVIRSPAKAWLGLLVALVLLPFATGTALALSCAAGPERLRFPPPGDIPPNPVFVFQGDGATGDVKGFTADTFDISFIGGHSRVRILERSDGVPSYVSFTPVKPLREGPFDLRMRRTFEGRSVEWTHLGTFKVHGPADERVPTLLQHEDHVIARVQDSSWGESITVKLPVTADESPVYWLATIVASEVRGALGQPITMFLPGSEPTLYTGPCGGNYPLAHGKQYLVDLTPIDAAGHRGQVTAPSILVEIP
jgi:hypothetical protein